MTGTGTRPVAVLAVGEALMDVVASASGVVEHPGGSPMNVSFGVARLEQPVALVTRLGDDARGAAIAGRLASAGVEVVPGPVTGIRTSSATATIGPDGSASYVFDVEWDFDLDLALALDARVIHFGSISAFLAPGAGRVGELIAAKRSSATISYDPNIRTQFLGSSAETLEIVERHVAASDLVKASDEDLAWLDPETTPERIAERWVGLGASVVVVTRGGDGAIAATRNGVISLPGRVVDVVDTIGAGDSFMAGLIASIIEHGLAGAENRAALAAVGHEVLLEIMDTAMRCAAITVGRAGAEPPTLAELRTR